MEGTADSEGPGEGVAFGLATLGQVVGIHHVGPNAHVPSSGDDMAAAGPSPSGSQSSLGSQPLGFQPSLGSQPLGRTVSDPSSSSPEPSISSLASTSEAPDEWNVGTRLGGSDSMPRVVPQSNVDPQIVHTRLQRHTIPADLQHVPEVQSLHEAYQKTIGLLRRADGDFNTVAWLMLGWQNMMHKVVNGSMETFAQFQRTMQEAVGKEKCTIVQANQMTADLMVEMQKHDAVLNRLAGNGNRTHQLLKHAESLQKRVAEEVLKQTEGLNRLQRAATRIAILYPHLTKATGPQKRKAGAMELSKTTEEGEAEAEIEIQIEEVVEEGQVRRSSRTRNKKGINGRQTVSKRKGKAVSKKKSKQASSSSSKQNPAVFEHVAAAPALMRDEDWKKAIEEYDPLQTLERIQEHLRRLEKRQVGVDDLDGLVGRVVTAIAEKRPAVENRAAPLVSSSLPPRPPTVDMDRVEAAVQDGILKALELVKINARVPEGGPAVATLGMREGQTSSSSSDEITESPARRSSCASSSSPENTRCSSDASSSSPETVGPRSSSSSSETAGIGTKAPEALSVETEKKRRRMRKLPRQHLAPPGIVKVTKKQASLFAVAAGFSARRAAPFLRTGVSGVHALVEYRRLAGDGQISCDQRAITMARTPNWNWKERPTGIAPDASVVLCCMCADLMTLQRATWWEGRIPQFLVEGSTFVEFGFRPLSTGPVNLAEPGALAELRAAVKWSPHEVWCYCGDCKDDVLRRRREKAKAKGEEWPGDFCGDIRLKNPAHFTSDSLRIFLRASSNF